MFRTNISVNFANQANFGSKDQKIWCGLARELFFHISKLYEVPCRDVGIPVCRHDKMVWRFGKRFCNRSDVTNNVVYEEPKCFILKYTMRYSELLLLQDCLAITGLHEPTLDWIQERFFIRSAVLNTYCAILKMSRFELLLCCEYVRFMPNGGMNILALVPV